MHHRFNRVILLIFILGIYTFASISESYTPYDGFTKRFDKSYNNKLIPVLTITGSDTTWPIAFCRTDIHFKMNNYDSIHMYDEVTKETFKIYSKDLSQVSYGEKLTQKAALLHTEKKYQEAVTFLKNAKEIQIVYFWLNKVKKVTYNLTSFNRFYESHRRKSATVRPYIVLIGPLITPEFLARKEQNDPFRNKIKWGNLKAGGSKKKKPLKSTPIDYGNSCGVEEIKPVQYKKNTPRRSKPKTRPAGTTHHMLKGKRSRASIIRVIRINEKKLQKEYRKILKDKKNFRGKITLLWTIDHYGAVLSCKLIRSTLDDPDFESKIISIVRSWSFGKFNSPGDVTEFSYTFMFNG